MAGNLFVLPKYFPVLAAGVDRDVQSVCGLRQMSALCPVRAGNKKCGSSGELPQRGSATRGMVPPVVAAVIARVGLVPLVERFDLVALVERFGAGSHMGWRRGLSVMARRWRVVIPGIIIMHTACPQDKEPGEQDQGQDMQEPDKSGMRTHRYSLVPFRVASPAKEQKSQRA